MAKYRRKAGVDEAMQWLGPRTDGPTPMPDGVCYDPNIGFHVVPINFQLTIIAPGDWIIVETQQPTNGFIHAYPCKADIFVASHEDIN
jgi:hypothetical protein